MAIHRLPIQNNSSKFAPMKKIFFFGIFCFSFCFAKAQVANPATANSGSNNKSGVLKNAGNSNITNPNAKTSNTNQARTGEPATSVLITGPALSKEQNEKASLIVSQPDPNAPHVLARPH